MNDEETLEVDLPTEVIDLLKKRASDMGIDFNSFIVGLLINAAMETLERVGFSFPVEGEQ